VSKLLEKVRSAGGRPQAEPAATGREVQRAYDIVQLRGWAGSSGVEVPRSRPHPQAAVDQYEAAGGR
jgi:hypothetical protein